MSEFNCPSCRAKVKKESSDKPGCPCCGFGDQNAKNGHKHTEQCSICHESRCGGHVICG